MPVYNREDLVVKAIESIKTQTYKNWTLIVVDDASSDRSCLNAVDINDNRIHVIRNTENVGAYRSLNRGLAYAVRNGIEWDLCTMVGSDDINHPSRFESFPKYFQYENVLALRTCAVKSNEPDKIVRPCGIIVMSREVFSLIGYYDNVRMAGDSEYMARIRKLVELNNNYRIANAEKTEVYYEANIGDDNLSLKGKKWRKIYSDLYKRNLSYITNVEDLYHEKL
jgi:glycosyltransferase involved in cell wall biosynthesis